MSGRKCIQCRRLQAEPGRHLCARCGVVKAIGRQGVHHRRLEDSPFAQSLRGKPAGSYRFKLGPGWSAGVELLEDGTVRFPHVFLPRRRPERRR